MAPGRSLLAANMIRPRRCTRSRAVSPSRTPAATRAVKWPRLCPATAAGAVGAPCSRRKRPRARWPARDAVSTQGWVQSVRAWSSRDVPKHRVRSGSPVRSSDRWNRSRTSPYFSYQRWAMPGNCAPWPGNSRAWLTDSSLRRPPLPGRSGRKPVRSRGSRPRPPPRRAYRPAASGSARGSPRVPGPHAAELMAEGTYPGATAFAVTPKRAVSRAMVRVSPSNPALEEAYAVWNGQPVSPATEVVKTSRPHPCRVIPGRTPRARSIAAVRLTAMLSSQSDRRTRCAAPGRSTAALLTSTSGARPCVPRSPGAP